MPNGMMWPYAHSNSYRLPMQRDGSHMKSKQWALANLFGPSNDARFAELIQQLSEVVGECSHHFIESGGRDLAGVIEFEHRADAIVDAIHELLDNSFILRFDVLDSMKLTEDLDNVIDGMRKVAIHMDVYKLHLQELRPEALELMQIGERMVRSLQQLVGMLGGHVKFEPRYPVHAIDGPPTIHTACAVNFELIFWNFGHGRAVARARRNLNAVTLWLRRKMARRGLLGHPASQTPRPQATTTRGYRTSFFRTLLAIVRRARTAEASLRLPPQSSALTN